MSEVEKEEKEEEINTKPYKRVQTESDEEENKDEDKETNIGKEEEKNENEELKIETVETRFKPKIKIDMEKQRYPYCIVWTPLPCFTWLFPSIGHVGICTSKGIIHDFAGPYYVSIDGMAFGNPTKYVLLDLDSREYDEYDSAIEGGTYDYNNKYYSFCCNNCHSFVARCLNHLKYKGKTNYTMIHVWWIFCIKGKFLNCAKFIQTYLGFFIIIILFLVYYFLFRYKS